MATTTVNTNTPRQDSARDNARPLDELRIRLEDPGDVEAGMAAALAHDGPVLVDAVVSRTELVMPPAVTTEMAKGFTLYMVKAVMSGRGDELLELARTNLWR
jgi:pyruvate dehydrogenase (quinone)